MTLDTNFVSVSEHPFPENTTSASKHYDFVHSVAFPNFDHSVHSENMAQPPTPPGPRERTLRKLDVPDFTYDSLCIQYEDVPYVLKTRLIHLLPKFNGLAGQDPHKHLTDFHLVCSTMKPHDVMEHHICLKAFPHSLEGPTKDWLYYLAPGSITGWGDLKRSFLGKFFHASRTTTITNDISGIRKQHGESLYDYWERFKRTCASCPHHQISGNSSCSYTGGFLPERELARLSEKGSIGRVNSYAVLEDFRRSEGWLA
ncbi:hypothetical protein Lal_00024449 [Lupinus albus]|nr:hypothetical protein Lal_00024449 [Lupinus albus]